jgi:hypothetical protein
MDDLNYRRLMKYQKRRCEESGATAYMDPQGIYRSIIEDHERFETCFDCGYLVGWCPSPETCEQPVWVAERSAKAGGKGATAKKAAAKKAAATPAATTPAAKPAAKKTARKAAAKKVAKKTAKKAAKKTVAKKK